MQTRNLALIGDGGVGKTTWLKHYTEGKFVALYHPTYGVQEKPISYDNHNFVIWDFAGQEKCEDFSKYYIKCDAAIIFFDLTNKITWFNLQRWTFLFAKYCPGKPILFIGNKADIKDARLLLKKEELIKFVNDKYPGNELIFMSSKREEDLYLPLERILQSLN